MIEGIIQLYQRNATDKEVAQAALDFLEAQGCPAREHDGSCQYWLEEPATGRLLKCAVGGLLPEDERFSECHGSVPNLIKFVHSYDLDEYGPLYEALKRYEQVLAAVQLFHDKIDFDMPDDLVRLGFDEVELGRRHDKLYADYEGN